MTNKAFTVILEKKALKVLYNNKRKAQEKDIKKISNQTFVIKDKMSKRRNNKYQT